MAKKYKNTVHKNPFREDRPKKNIPWKLICVIAGFLALILITTLVLNSLLGTRKFRLVSGGGFHENRDNITYYMAPLCYQPVTIIKKDVFAKYNDTSFYAIEGVATEQMITTAEDGFYEIYYNKAYPLPSLFEMNVNGAIICDVGTAVIPVGMMETENAKSLIGMLKNESLYCDYPTDAKLETENYLYFTSTDYPHLYYYVHFIKTTDGARYIYDSAYERCVPIGDLLSDVLG